MAIHSDGTTPAGEALFRAIFAASPVGMALVSLEYRFLQVNAELCRITGYSEAELLERTFVDITHPDDLDSDVALARRLAGGEIPHYQLEKRYVRKDGQPVWILLGGGVVRDDSGAPLYFVATIQDISDAKSADAVRRDLESRLRESEARHRQTLDAIDDFVFVKDRASRLVWANRAFCDYYGMSVAELSGRLDAPTTPADVTSAYLEADALVLERGATEVIDEEPIVRSDGTVRLFNTVKSPLRGTDGGVVGLVGVARDVTERNRLRDELARSERYYRALIESSRDMLLVIDREGKNVYVSPANQRATGWKPEERLGRESFALVHPEDLPRVKAALESLLKDPSYQATIEYRWRHRDGSWMWLEAVARNLLDDPAVGGIIVNARDVTARHEIEERLAHSERYHRALIENALDVITIIDANGVQRFVSPSVEEVLGWRPDRLVGRDAFELIHPADVSRVLALFAEHIAQPGARHKLEFRIRHQDGTWRHLESVARNLFDDPAVRAAVVHSRDVTARHEIEDRLAESEAYFRALIEQASDVVTVLEPDGTMRYLSPAIRSILGYEPDELVGTPLLELVHPDDRSTIAAAVAKWPTAPELASGSAPALFRARHQDGSWRYLEGTGRISFDDPVVHGVVGSVRDVTERVAADEERERLIGELTEALQQVKTLQGLLPICSSCKRVRDDQGYWTQIEAYLRRHSQTEFSHGICPSCAKSLYPEYYDGKSTDEIK